MDIVAYCRVSTDKQDQLNSLATQKQFFVEYAEKNGHHLVKVYADEGISGTKTKNRKQFLQLMRDARQKCFDMVVVKDISRFARNTVDLLQNVRQLKALGIETTFLTANMTVLGQSEFVLTVFGALAQEESANMSKRIKFGKHENAKKGKVPNMVYGYDKIIGDYFNLTINDKESEVVKKIYHWYVHAGYGALKIANMLNEQGYVTKRNCKFSQNAICRILTNPIYTGKLINGKQEISDFLTGSRVDKSMDEWNVFERPELAIIDENTFEQAQKILKSKKSAFNMKHERKSNRYLFSTLIKCKDCGWSFRRVVRHYKNTYIRWVCSGHNGRGADSCPNAISLDEDELIQEIDAYLAEIIQDEKKLMNRVKRAFIKKYKSYSDNEEHKQELENRLFKCKKTREKYMDMYTDDLISREELNEKIGGMKTEIERIENKLKFVNQNLDKGEQLESIIKKTLNGMKSVTSIRNMSNVQLRNIIDRIEVDHEGHVDIYLKLCEELGIDNTVLVCDDHT